MIMSEVWRYPCHSPLDVCALEAVKLDASAGPLPQNAILFSRAGDLNTKMAGGNSSDKLLCDLFHVDA